MNPLRKVLIGGNWKSNGDVQFAKNFVPQVLNKLKFNKNNCEVIVSPASIHMSLVKSLITNEGVHVSSQNVSQYPAGAYTGEVTSKMLKDLDFNWTLTGHSERRQYFGETSEVVAIKTKNALDAGLNVIACIGENLTEREENRTLDVCISQLGPIMKTLNNLGAWKNVVIAYEPVWAIGTGKTASPEQAQEVHMHLRAWLRKNLSETVANETRIIYGGSVTEKNAKDLITQGDIDGFLVGGASLKPAFSDIVESSGLKF
jgi:triosephosphate isomerase